MGCGLSRVGSSVEFNLRTPTPAPPRNQHRSDPASTRQTTEQGTTSTLAPPAHPSAVLGKESSLQKNGKFSRRHVRPTAAEQAPSHVCVPRSVPAMEVRLLPENAKDGPTSMAKAASLVERASEGSSEDVHLFLDSAAHRSTSVEARDALSPAERIDSTAPRKRMSRHSWARSVMRAKKTPQEAAAEHLPADPVTTTHRGNAEEEFEYMYSMSRPPRTRSPNSQTQVAKTTSTPSGRRSPCVDLSQMLMTTEALRERQMRVQAPFSFCYSSLHGDGCGGKRVIESPKKPLNARTTATSARQLLSAHAPRETASDRGDAEMRLISNNRYDMSMITDSLDSWCAPQSELGKLPSGDSNAFSCTFITSMASDSDSFISDGSLHNGLTSTRSMMRGSEGRSSLQPGTMTRSSPPPSQRLLSNSSHYESFNLSSFKMNGTDLKNTHHTEEKKEEGGSEEELRMVTSLIGSVGSVDGGSLFEEEDEDKEKEEGVTGSPRGEVRNTSGASGLDASSLMSPLPAVKGRRRTVTIIEPPSRPAPLPRPGPTPPDETHSVSNALPSSVFRKWSSVLRGQRPPQRSASFPDAVTYHQPPPSAAAVASASAPLTPLPRAAPSRDQKPPSPPKRIGSGWVHRLLTAPERPAVSSSTKGVIPK